MRHMTIIATFAIALAMPTMAYADEVPGNHDMPEQESQAEATVSAEEFQFHGVVEGCDKTFTWYSERVLPGDGLTELNGNGRTVNDSGYVVDGEGYIAVASPWGVDAIGTVIETPFGPAKVYDVCEDDSYDIFTSW